MRNNQARREKTLAVIEPVTLYLEAKFSASHLKGILEPLYLGQPGAYRLVFSHEMLFSIERCFDELIEKYGYRADVDFEYSMKGKDEKNVRRQ